MADGLAISTSSAGHPPPNELAGISVERPQNGLYNPPDPMNHVKIFKGWPRRDASCGNEQAN